MAGKVRIEFDAQSQRALQEFDKLTKKQQRVVIEGSKMGKEFEKAGKKAEKSGKRASSAWGGMANKLKATVDVQNLLATGLRAVNREFENQIRLQKEAAGKQTTFESAVGNFIANNQLAIREDPQLLNKVRKFSQRQGARLGTGGPQQVIEALTQVRSEAGEGFTLQQQLSSVQKAVQGKILDPTAQIGAIASANLRVQKALGVSETQAQNALIAFGPTAGGDVNAFVSQFGKLAGLSGATREVERRQFGKPQTRLADILALEGITSQALGLSPEETTTLVQSVVSKIGSARIGTKGINFKSQNAIDRILELSDRVLGGEFGVGAERQQLLTSAGLKGSQALPFLGALSNSSKQLESARRSIFTATTTTEDFQKKSLGYLSESAMGIQRANEAKGRLEVSQITDVTAGTRESRLAEARAIAEAQGYSFGQLDDLLSRVFGTDPRAAALGAREDVINQLASLFVGQTEAQKQAEDRARKLQYALIDEMRRTNTSVYELIKNRDIAKQVISPGEGQ